MSETKYYWNTIEVFPVPGQVFSTHWNCYYQQPTEDGGHRRVVISLAPEQISQSAPVVDIKVESEQKLLNINLASFSTIREALGAGIGRVAPKTFIKNRPTDGYRDFADFKSLNKELDNVNWEEIEKKIVFE